MQQDTEALYFQLIDLARSPKPENEKEVLPQIKEWTSLFIIADSSGDSKTQAYILSKKPYLSKKLLQAANCFPLHRLAALQIDFNEDDLELLDALLSSEFFHLADQDTKKFPVIYTALSYGNLAFFHTLKQRNHLEFFTEKLRMSCKTINLIRLSWDTKHISMLATLLALDIYEPNDYERITIDEVLIGGLNSFYEIHKGNKIYQLFLIACFRFDRIISPRTNEVPDKQYFDFPLLTRYLEENYDSISLTAVDGVKHPIYTYAVCTVNKFLLSYLQQSNLQKHFENEKYEVVFPLLYDEIKFHLMKIKGKPCDQAFFESKRAHQPLPRIKILRTGGNHLENLVHLFIEIFGEAMYRRLDFIIKFTEQEKATNCHYPSE